jgi:hypothetical protein
MDPILWVILVVGVAAVAFFVWRRQQGGGGEQPTKTLHSAIVGVTTEDEHGLSPQQQIINLQPGDRLGLVAADQDGAPAVQVQEARGSGHLGWLEDGIAPEVRAALETDSRVECKVADITGGTRGNPNLGVSIQIDFYET